MDSPPSRTSVDDVEPGQRRVAAQRKDESMDLLDAQLRSVTCVSVRLPRRQPASRRKGSTSLSSVRERSNSHASTPGREAEVSYRRRRASSWIVQKRRTRARNAPCCARVGAREPMLNVVSTVLVTKHPCQQHGVRGGRLFGPGERASSLREHEACRSAGSRGVWPCSRAARGRCRPWRARAGGGPAPPRARWM